MNIAAYIADWLQGYSKNSSCHMYSPALQAFMGLLPVCGEFLKALCSTNCGRNPFLQLTEKILFEQSQIL